MPTPRPHSRWGKPRQYSGRWARAAEWPVALRGDGGHRRRSCCRTIGDPAANEDEEVSVPPRPQRRSGPGRRTTMRSTSGAAAVLPLTALAACGGSARDSNTIRVAFQQFGSGTLMEQWIQRTAENYSRDFPDRTIELVPIVASENDYFTKNELRSEERRVGTHGR